MNNVYLSVADEFSRTPGARYRKEGRFSAEEFLETLARDRFKQARASGVKLIIDLDRTAGYATSFLEGTFGGLARAFGKDAVKETVEFITDDDPFLRRYINRYIEEADQAAVLEDV